MVIENRGYLEELVCMTSEITSVKVMHTHQGTGRLGRSHRLFPVTRNKTAGTQGIRLF